MEQEQTDKEWLESLKVGDMVNLQLRTSHKPIVVKVVNVLKTVIYANSQAFGYKFSRKNGVQFLPKHLQKNEVDFIYPLTK